MKQHTSTAEADVPRRLAVPRSEVPDLHTTANGAGKKRDRAGLVSAARGAAAAAAQRAGVSVGPLPEMVDAAAAAALWARVWGRNGDAPMNAELLRALSESGNYLAGALRDATLVGALAGFYAGVGRPDHLHSHILGVDSSTRVGGVGFALKLDQRSWALDRDLDEIRWTFDPLVRGNAYFNLSKLGAQGVRYHVNFYGAMPDEINGGDESDRLLVSWQLGSAEAVTSSAGLAAEAEIDVLLAAGAQIVVAVGSEGEPRLKPCAAEVRLCQIPQDIVDLRQRRPALARHWRLAVREAMRSAFANGLHVRSFSRAGWYVLARPDKSI
ncbi:MAG: GNAT family N-acetyltransferase [Candidatus Dormibacteria bacterium]